MSNLTPSKREKIRKIIQKHDSIKPGLFGDIRRSPFVFGLSEFMNIEDRDTCNDLYRKTIRSSLSACFFGTANSIMVYLILKNRNIWLRRSESIGIFFATYFIMLYNPIQNNVAFSQKLYNDGFFNDILKRMDTLDKGDGFVTEIETEDQTL